MSAPVAVDRALAAEMARAALEHTSGVVSATRGKLKRLFCLGRGRLVWAASNVVEEQLVERLVRSGRLDVEARIDADERARVEGKKLTALLVEQEILPRRELEDEIGAHVRELLFATLDWRDGEVGFAAGKPRLDGEVTVDLSVARLVFDYSAERPRSLDELRMRIGGPGLRTRRVESRDPLLRDVQASEILRHLVTRSDGTLKLSDLLGRSPGSTEETLRVLYGLLLLGVLEEHVESAAARRKPVSETVSLDELMARFKRVRGADYYTVLEMGTTATTEEIREAYYFLARRYHPDRFSTGPLRNMLPEIESFFSQVTEAYNNLIDPVLRADYDRKRSADSPVVREPEPEQDKAYLARQNFARAKLIGKGRNFEAVTFLENAVGLDDLQSIYHLTLGELLARNPRRRGDAEKHLLRAVQLEPTDFEGWLGLGRLYRKTGRDIEAAEMFREVLRWEAAHDEATRELAEIERGPGRGLRDLFRG